MQYVIVNFSKTDFVSLGIKFTELIGCDDTVQEFNIESFFSDEFYDILKKYKSLLDENECYILGFNYPVENDADRQSIVGFFKYAISVESNVCYYPKPNEYLEIDEFAMFSLCNKTTLDNYAIELLYRTGKMEAVLRNKIHPLLRKASGLGDDIVNKKFFYESRKLFNLSWNWEAYKIDKDSLKRDLTDRISIFYPAPKTINIGLTNECNLKCVMCAFHSDKYKNTHTTDFFASKKQLDDSIVYKAIDYAIDSNCYSIDFTSPGESLLDSRIFDFVKYARDKSKSIRIGLLTNAILLSETTSKKLLDNGLNIIAFSVDGATSETYKKIRGVSLDVVEKNIKKFIDISKNYSGIEIGINCVLGDMTALEKDEYISKWKNYDNSVTINFQGLLEYDEKGTHLKSKPNVDIPRFPCGRPWNCQLGILPNGDISVCCSMGGYIGWKDYRLGNVYREDLNEIWTKTLNGLRLACLDNNFINFDCCKGCTEWSWDIFDTNNDTITSDFREAVK